MEGDSAHKLLREEHYSDIYDLNIKNDYKVLYIRVLEETIRHMNQIIEKK